MHNTLVGGDKLSLVLESSVGFSGTLTLHAQGSKIDDDARIFRFGIGAKPVPQYSLTDKHIFGIGAKWESTHKA